MHLPARILVASARTTRTALVFLAGARALTGIAQAAETFDYFGPVPTWAKCDVPENISRFEGWKGLVGIWPLLPEGGSLGNNTRGIDKWQANHQIPYRSETARYIEREYTPMTVAYRPGTLPLFEALVRKYTTPAMSPRQAAVALLRAMPEMIRHATVPPVAAGAVPPDRNLDEEALVATQKGWCNEQARVFVRLCQVAKIPARLVFLHFDRKLYGIKSHVVTEFYADGHWVMADSSWYIVFPDAQGRLMSAAEIHDQGPREKLAAERYFERNQELLKLPETDYPPDAERTRRELREATVPAIQAALGTFAVLNYPLPR
jgi:transglutaminase-like putative cysteine protease